MLGNISSLVNVRWFLGIPFNDTSNFRLGIVESGQQILGDYLIGFQVGNEPDLYKAHGHRPQVRFPYPPMKGILMHNSLRRPIVNMITLANLAI